MLTHQVNSEFIKRGGITTQNVFTQQNIIDGVEAENKGETKSYVEIKAILDELLTQISSQGKLLIQSPIYENLVKYKDLVKRFMQEVISNVYVLKKHITSQAMVRKTGQKPTVYFMIEEVNKELITLTEEILRNQAQPIAIAGRLNFIQGILMDMYM
jgi:hypothetical protein